MTPREKELAVVRLTTGRFCLVVGGVFVAMEGDPCRDPMLMGQVWDKESLDDAARIINAEAEAR